MPEKRIGGRFGVTRACDSEREIGRVVWGTGRAGKCEMSGVLAGGSERPNSVARDERGVALGERANSTLVPRVSKFTRLWGVMSLAKA